MGSYNLYLTFIDFFKKKFPNALITKNKGFPRKFTFLMQKIVQTKKKIQSSVSIIYPLYMYNFIKYKHILWCFWWVHLVHFGNYIKNCVMPIKFFHELNFRYFGMEFLHCVLIPKGIVDMTFISSFAYINWNELQFKI